MKELLKLQMKLVPELLTVLDMRYNILSNIYYNQPIGRRMLSNNLNLSERIIRSEVNFLKEQNLIDINSIGMNITDEGKDLLRDLKFFIREIKGFKSIELEIANLLHIKGMVMVPGDVEEDKSVLREISKISSEYIKNLLEDNIIISLTGGNTVKEVVDSFQATNEYKDIMVLPARGGMGTDIELQSNTLAGRLASKINGRYEILHIPDSLSKETVDAILNEPEIKRIFEGIKKSTIVIHGIGDATRMSHKRELNYEIIKKIKSEDAVGEAYGHYFNADGKIVYSLPNIGINENEISKIKHMIAVAAGKRKARAIIASIKDRKNEVLFTDEATAKEIYNILTETSL